MRVLVVEDDKNLREQLASALTDAGYTVDGAADGEEGQFLGETEPYDLVILDLGLPKVDGLSVLKALRAAQNETPVIVLSALAHADERVNGLRAGADDYLGKPFTFSELHLRVENLLKRRAGKETQTTLICGDLVMDLLTRRVTRSNKPIDLLQREFQILEHMLRHKDRVVTRTMLLEQVWDYRFDPHTSLIDTHMSRLRKKIDDGFASPLLHTIRGVGYRLSEQP